MTRIKLELNQRMTQEDMLIERIRSLPKARREEYLRNLLIKGFRQECLESRPAAQPATTNKQPFVSDQQPTPPQPTQRSTSSEPEDLSLASLKDVIG